ncbi:hypothetical protein [Sphingomonas sp. IC081]|uniref:hypothetical protein n=1 Tax=Sphingomonas sp. IC081 TaxID=304378 RepID=UPI001C8EA365|nr:hypothetical protein [Sphingomonas sp. IC081]
MRWSNDGLMTPTCIFEAATLHRSVLVVCRCGQSSRFEAHCLWWHFERRRWNDQFGPARERFWCRVCRSPRGVKVRPVTLEPVPWAEGDFELPWPPEHSWKAAVRRVR